MKKDAIINSVLSLAAAFGVAQLCFTINKSAYKAVVYCFYDILYNFDLLSNFSKLLEEEQEEQEEEKTD